MPLSIFMREVHKETTTKTPSQGPKIDKPKVERLKVDKPRPRDIRPGKPKSQQKRYHENRHHKFHGSNELPQNSTSASIGWSKVEKSKLEKVIKDYRKLARKYRNKSLDDLIRELEELPMLGDPTKE